jgi:hypothetical protein
VYLVGWMRRIKAPSCCVPAPPKQQSQVLPRRHAVCLRHPDRYHVGEVDDHAILVGLAVIPRMGQDQAALLVQRCSVVGWRRAQPGMSPSSSRRRSTVAIRTVESLQP